MMSQETKDYIAALEERTRAYEETTKALIEKSKKTDTEFRELLQSIFPNRSFDYQVVLEERE